MLALYFLSYTKIKSHWSNDLNLKPKCFLEGNISRTLIDINCSNIFFGSVSYSNGNEKKDKQMGPN